MKRIHPSTPYVYAVTVDGVPRYIGKGRGSRRSDHLRECRSIARRRASGEAIVTTLFYNRLTAAWLDGAEIETIVLHECETDEAAFDLEVAEIAHRVGLWNGDSGGRGGNTAGMGMGTELARKRAATARQHARMSPEAKIERVLRIKASLAERFEGSVLSRTLAFVTDHPGSDKRAIVDALGAKPTTVAVALCKLMRTSMIERRGVKYFRSKQPLMSVLK